MADSLYRGIYRKQGGDELVVASSGTITLEGTLSSTGTIALGPVAAGTTTANLPAGGVSLVVAGTSGTGTNVYTIANPVIGQPKWITATAVTNATSDHITIVGPTTTVTFGPTALPKLRFVAAGTAALVGRTTAIYDFVPLSTAIVYATSAA